VNYDPYGIVPAHVHYATILISIGAGRPDDHPARRVPSIHARTISPLSGRNLGKIIVTPYAGHKKRITLDHPGAPHNCVGAIQVQPRLASRHIAIIDHQGTAGVHADLRPVNPGRIAPQDAVGQGRLGIAPHENPATVSACSIIAERAVYQCRLVINAKIDPSRLVCGQIPGKKTVRNDGGRTVVAVQPAAVVTGFIPDEHTVQNRRSAASAINPAAIGGRKAIFNGKPIHHRAVSFTPVEIESSARVFAVNNATG